MSKKAPPANSKIAEVTDQTGGKRVVVVLGSGRSGTSVCAKILGQLGIRMETTLHRPNEMNPDGYFEDVTLAKINKRLLEKLAPLPGVGPLSNYPARLIKDEVQELRAHLEERPFSDDGIWGFKHPRVSLLLPVYRRAFQAIGIVPRYVFCARAGASVVESLMEADGCPRDQAERIYFFRCFLALRDSAVNCHVLHYERLLENPATQIKNLWSYVNELGEPCPLDDKACAALVDSKLNRSVLRAAPLNNVLAQRIDALIATMEGTTFDRDAVFSELREIDSFYDGYQDLIDRAGARLNASRSAAEKANTQVSDLTRKFNELTTEVQMQKDQDSKHAEIVTQISDFTAQMNMEQETAAENIKTMLSGFQAQLDAQKDAHQEQLAAAQAQIRTLTQEIQTSQAQATQSVQDQKDAHQEQLAAAQAQIKTLTQEVQTSQTQATQTAQDHADTLIHLEQRISAQRTLYETEIETLRNEYQILRVASDTLLAQQSDIQTSCVRLEEERNAAIVQARSHAGTLQQLEAKLAQLTQYKSRSLHRETKLQTEIDTLNTNIRELSDTTSAQRDRLRKENQTLRAKLA